MQSNKADSFSAYLEAMQRSKSSAPSSTGTPLSLLNALAGAEKKAMPLTELMNASGMAFPEFAEALKTLRDSGYLTLGGPPSAELVTLTSQGEEVSRLARK
jgi:predicted transcriptional regulator